MAPKSTTNTRSIAKVIYKPSTQSTDEYTVVVNVDEFTKWKAGDTSIPLTEVVDSFEILFSNQGAQGILRTPSDQQLENEFGTKKDVDVVRQILEKGAAKESDAPRSTDTVTMKNIGRTSAVIDTRGNRLSGI